MLAVTALAGGLRLPVPVGLGVRADAIWSFTTWEQPRGEQPSGRQPEQGDEAWLAKEGAGTIPAVADPSGTDPAPQGEPQAEVAAGLMLVADHGPGSGLGGGAPLPKGRLRQARSRPSVDTLRVTCVNLGLGRGGWANKAAIAMEWATRLKCAVVGFSETHHVGGNPPSLQGFDGYQYFSTSRPERRVEYAWGGCTIAVSTGPTSPVEQVHFVDQCSKADVLWVKLQPRGGTMGRVRPVFVCCAYLTPDTCPSRCRKDVECRRAGCAKNHVKVGLQFMRETAVKFSKEGDVIMMGDWNANCRPVSPAATGEGRKGPPERRWAYLKDAMFVVNGAASDV